MQSEHLSPHPAQWLAERCNLIVCPYHDERFSEALAEADGLIVRTYTQVNEELLAQAPTLRVVGRAGVALENIDISGCRSRGIEVVHAPGSNAQAVVEYVLCLLCDALRPRATVRHAIDQEAWDKLRADVFARRQISERTIGILGLGRIGKRIAEVGRAIGCDVIYNDIMDIPETDRFGATSVTPEELFARADIVTIHIDSRPENDGFIAPDLLARMKHDALLINTSRGFVVDAGALAEFLKRNPDAHAMIDVHEPEPFGDDYPLLNLPNAKLFPHLAGRTETALENMSWVVRDVWSVLNGEQPQHPAP